MTRRIDSYNLRLFAAVAHAGSIARAAEQEHIAASALGRRLADLEGAFGTALLVRSPRGVALTDAGRLVLERGSRIDDALQALVRDVQGLGAELAGTVRLYANMSSIVGALPERLRRFKKTHPNVHVSLHEADTKDVIRACLDDRADVGIGVRADVPPGIETWRFAADPLQVVFPADHPLAAEPSVAFSQVLDYPVIGVHQGGALDRLLHERAQAVLRRFAPEVSVSSFDAVHRMVEAGLGIAVVPMSAVSAARAMPPCVHRPLSDPWAQRTLVLYALRRNPQPRAVQALTAALAAHAQG
ncbi:LysR substrate-binding domain-containing protein [Acidovorax sp. NCPPB 2350]|nr:LysR substrate-binding domain-containing protein [Acidovorax sp. NCPPB 2350]